MRPSSDQDQAEQDQDHRHGAEVGGGESRTHGAAENGDETASFQVLPDQLEPGMRGNFLAAGSVMRVAVDTGASYLLF